MKNRSSLILFVSLLLFMACHGQKTTSKTGDSTSSRGAGPSQEPNFNYVVEVPDGWTKRDTVVQGMAKFRFLISPPSLKADLPAGNVLIANMEGRNIDDFTTRNISYLKSNMSGIQILERGSIDQTAYNGQWFTYTKVQNGIARDMINYLIPINGYAYMITCGCNKGSGDKYRATFDKIARSLKANN